MSPTPEAARRRARPSRLRRSLAACTAEGVVAELVGACTGASVLTAWALHLGASKWLIGLLGALPFFAQFPQLPAAWLTSSFGARRVAITAVTAGRQAHLALAALPLLPIDPSRRIGVLLAVAATSALLGVIGNNAWVAWMGDLVPGAIRGRYWGRRSALCTLGSALSSLAAGASLDLARKAGHPEIALGALGLLASLAGAVTTLLMTRQHAPRARGARPALRWADVLEPLADPRGRRVLAYQAGWGAAGGIAATFYAIYMLEVLGIGFIGTALHGATLALARTLAAPAWGRVLDRVGARPVLVSCVLGVGVISVSWIFITPSFVWLLALDALFAGALYAGHSLAAFALPLRIAPRGRRPFYLAAFALTTGLAQAGAAVIGGAIVSALPERFTIAGRAVHGLQVLFVIAALLRGLAAILAARILEPGAGSLRDLANPAISRVARRFVRARGAT